MNKPLKQKHLVGFLKAYPNPKDEDVHVWAQKHNYQVDKVEEGIYRLATKCVRMPTSFRRISR
jgi:hypothetical protein